MDKEFLKQQKIKLEKEKKRIEEELESFAQRKKGAKGGWETIYPQFDGEKLEEAADEVEEYGNLLPLERRLEEELRKIDKSLEKIKKGKYGICEKCKKPISKERLKAYPQAEYCKKCQGIRVR